MTVAAIVTVALTAAQMALTMTRKIEGPRLDDLKVSVADYGTPLNYFHGIRRFDAVPIIFAENIREERHRNKTKGGKYNDYKYFGTWAVAVADHEIEAVTRIWFDKHLVYDATGAGPITLFDLGATSRFARRSVSDSIRFYLGTEDQEADPRMLATVEAAQGAGSCPAYRGVASIMFEEIPLEKIGNRIPQISVEAVTAATPHYPRDTFEGTYNATNFQFSADWSKMFWYNVSGNSFELWDLPSLSPLFAYPLGGVGGAAVGADGGVWSLGSDPYGGPVGYVLYKDGVQSADFVADYDLDYPSGFDNIQVLNSLADGHEIVFLGPYSTYEVYGVVGLSTGPFVRVTDGYQMNTAFGDLDGNIWAVGGYWSGARMIFRQIYGGFGDYPSEFEVDTPTTLGGSFIDASAFHFRDADHDYFIFYFEGVLGIIDMADRSLVTTVAGGANTLVMVMPGASTFWIGATEYDSVTLAVLRSYSSTDLKTLWGPTGGYTIDSTFYDPNNHALISGHSSTNAGDIRYLDRIGSAGVLLSDIVEDVSNRCGIDPANVDASDLDQTVQGYSWSQGAGKDILEPLLDAFDSIARPHDFGIQFLKLGDSTGGSIATAQFVRQGDEPRYKVTIAQDTDLPRRVTFSFADKDKDQQTNSVVVQRPLDSVDGVRETSIDMTTLALDVDEARQLAERWFRRRWFSRETIELGLTAQYLALEPGDVRTLYRDDEPATFRLEKSTLAANGVIGCLWVRDDPTVAVLSGATGATMDGRSDATIPVLLFTKGFILDIPLIRDADNDTNPVLYYGAGPHSAGTWPGAVVYQSLDAGEDYDVEWASVPSTSGLTWGATTDVLANASVAVWDRGNAVNVVVRNGTLTSTTEAACDTAPSVNLALIGDELVQYTTATLEGDGSYTLSGLKRGRRGTEWATGTHAAGDKFVLLDAVGNVEMGASDLGDALYFKAVSVGRDPSSAFPITLSYAGNSLKPYAPAQLHAVKDAGSGDWTFSWVRRSRIGGAWTGGTSVPLGEDSEAYELDIVNGASVVRTISVSAQSATYTAAQQTTDFGGSVAVGDLDCNLYQISAVVDRGFATAGSF